MNTALKIGIIGGGASGFFAAIKAKETYANAEVTIFEKLRQPLRKVKISGGGRCNLTNAVDSLSELSKAYPRGGKQLKKLFHTFNNKHTIEWFESRGVELVTQDDNCVFPKSQDSESIIMCLINETRRLQIKVEYNCSVLSIIQKNPGFELEFTHSDSNQFFDKLIVTTGGSPKKEGLLWLEELGHATSFPIPSLFSFNMPREAITNLMGVVVPKTQVQLQGTKTKSEGALLITHWGMSGPAILKLSSICARELYDCNYTSSILVNWAEGLDFDTVQNTIKETIVEHPQKQASNIKLFNIPTRLWEFILYKSEIPETKKWNELGKKSINKLTSILTSDEYLINGQSKHTDEYVTCGGISLQNVSMQTLESKVCPGLYFAGEVLDIDAITGGFNLQAAWTTGYIAGMLQ